MIDRRNGWRLVSRLGRALCLLVAIWLPQAAVAGNSAAVPTTIHFHLKFDKSKVAPQPMIDPDRGPYVVTRVELNGHPLNAVLDTGAELTVIDSSAAEQIGLKPAASFETAVLGGSGVAPISEVNVDKLAAGAVTRTGGWIGMMDLSALRRQVHQDFSMILGADFLSQVALQVDQDRRTVTFLRSGTPPSAAYAKLPLELSQPGNHYVIPVNAAGHAIQVRIDTGSDGELDLVDSKWSQLVPADARTSDLLERGAGGVFVETIARLDAASLGSLPIGDAVVNRTTSPAATRADGVIGMGILSRLDFFMDAHAGVMAVAKPTLRAPPRRESLVGIQRLTTDEGITIMHVMANSPAQSAGLKDGDRICSVDGEKVDASWIGTAKDDWPYGPPGKTVTLGRCGGGTVQVTLRPFY